MKKQPKVIIRQEYGPLNLCDIEMLRDKEGWRNIKRLSYDLFLRVFDELEKIGLAEFEIKNARSRDLVGCARVISYASDRVKDVYRKHNQERLSGERDFNFSCLLV